MPVKVAALAACALLLIVTACSNGDGEPTATVFVPGDDTIIASYGSIDYSGASPSIKSDHVLSAIRCQDGAFTMTTSAGVFSGSMDCAALPPPDVLETFVGEPIVITVRATRVRIEGLGAGTLDMPVANTQLAGQ